jgi:hypothetical protein
MIADKTLGCIIAFLCAAIAVGADAQTEVRTRFGQLYDTSIFRTWPAYVFIIGWGMVDVSFFLAFLSNHDWAKRAFGIDVEDNLLWMGVVVGFSAVLIIRTNLATVGSVQIGGEYVYVWTRSFLIDRLNRRRARRRREFLIRFRPFCNDVAAYPKYFISLQQTLTNLAKGSAQGTEIMKQLTAITANPQSDPTAPRGPDGTCLRLFWPR